MTLGPAEGTDSDGVGEVRLATTVDRLCTCIERVFSTMVHRPLVPLERYEGTPRVPGSVVGTVGFASSRHAREALTEEDAWDTCEGLASGWSS